MTQNDKKSTYQRDVTILKERFTLNHFIIVFLQEFFATFFASIMFKMYKMYTCSIF